ncbi:MAG: precorrin-3B C(17)-methyltransferase [Alicyclobacillaceae bacterium]|jgi:precorrin-3B C17-methyltransferase|uniref:precorrin-3B C(17)-methyltransferase n=1 Tax=Alicyclobacillus sp. SP_1 TaxID=2942475 RepID=UPI002157B03D|nr:precorrin-3B C(17)-methyltransferase [Alicyclobacillus sp. SP_1]MCY0887364.1 precorrin-3B C(17)-methyltransferase [Alicyclobacillaceae bacterium]
MTGTIYVVGFGPGHEEHLTGRARNALVASDTIIGYNTYIDLIRPLLTGQEIVRTGMTEEVSRAQKAVQLAEEGHQVAVISSGDAGVYGMAGLVYEVLVSRGWQSGDHPNVEVIPGISAIQSCASLLGAPVMHDACTISLSDHLTPWEVIAKRIEAAAAADFVIALYNPKSGRRTRQIVETQRILLEHRDPNTPVGIVKSAYRKGEQVVRTTLVDMLEHDIGMLTTVLIGNSQTFFHGPLMITPRGYERKYTLDTVTQRLRPGERLHVENEPWSLAATAPKASRSTPPISETPSPTHRQEPSNRSTLTARDWADAALARIAGLRPSTAEATARAAGGAIGSVATIPAQTRQAAMFEVAVSPGVANKRITTEQLLLLAEIAGETGSVEYTPAHQLILRARTLDAAALVGRLEAVGLVVQPVGEVVRVKACDFCDGDKAEGIPYAEEIHRRLAGLGVEKELRIGFNGCAMSCYGAVHEDIGIVFRKGKVDLFLGGKTTGRNAMPAQRVAEAIPAEVVPDLLERIVQRYRAEAFPNERFHKFFQRVGVLEGYAHKDAPAAVVADGVCGT